MPQLSDVAAISQRLGNEEHSSRSNARSSRAADPVQMRSFTRENAGRVIKRPSSGDGHRGARRAAGVSCRPAGRVPGGPGEGRPGPSRRSPAAPRAHPGAHRDRGQPSRRPRVVTLRQIWYLARRDARAGTWRAPRRVAGRRLAAASGVTDGPPGRPAPARSGEPDTSGLPAIGRSHCASAPHKSI